MSPPETGAHFTRVVAACAAAARPSAEPLKFFRGQAGDALRFLRLSRREPALSVEEPVREISAAPRDPINAAWIVFGNGELEGLLELMAVLACLDD